MEAISLFIDDIETIVNNLLLLCFRLPLFNDAFLEQIRVKILSPVGFQSPCHEKNKPYVLGNNI